MIILIYKIKEQVNNSYHSKFVGITPNPGVSSKLISLFRPIVLPQLDQDHYASVHIPILTRHIQRGYNSVNQIAGYLISNDPAYISSHNNARSVIQQVERHEIIEELVRAYLEVDEK